MNDRDDGISFLGEIGISADYQISHHFALRVGYQFGFLTGMALAPEQISGSDLSTNTARLDKDANLYFDGAYFGLDCSW